MGAPRYQRVDAGVVTPLSAVEIRPYVRRALTRYFDTLKDEYGEDLMTPEEGEEASMRDHNIVLINDEYILAYIIGAEWYSKGALLHEEYLMRIGPGPTKLHEVFAVMETLAELEGASGFQVGTRAATNKAAIRRLYEREGLTEVMTTLRK